MANYHWRELFPTHIWQRGRSYYLEGRVRGIRRLGNCVTASVEGTDNYAVSVTLNPNTNRIEDHFCDCPYGEDGTPCKHLAALLCALEDKDTIPKGNEKSPAIETIVAMLSENQMRQLLVEMAANDSLVWEKILLTATNQLPTTQKDRWECDLQQLTDEAADRYGFIDYEDAYDYCLSLQEYLYNRIPGLLKNGLITEAFELVCLVFQTGMEQDMDDSGGGLTELAECCMGEWNRIITLSSMEDQKKMFHWFREAHNKGDLVQMFLDDYMFAVPWEPELASEIMDFLDQQIQRAKREDRDYRLGEFVTHRINWMNKTGASKEDRKAYISQNHHLSAVRAIEIDEAKRNMDWDTALSLLEESKALDAEKRGLVARYSEQIIEIYETIHNKTAAQKEVEYYLFTFRQDDLRYVEKLKSLLSPCEWEQMRCRLLDSKTMACQVYPLLAQEELYEQLMDKIEADGFISALQQYEDVLADKFPQRCMRMYETCLQKAIHQASNRKAYWSVIQSLKGLAKYPDGKMAMQKLADSWKSQYPRRTSLLDELRKAGL